MDRNIEQIIKEIAKEENLNEGEVRDIIKSQFKFLRKHINKEGKEPIKFHLLGKFIFSNFLYKKNRGGYRKSNRRLVEFISKARRNREASTTENTNM